MSEEQEKKIDRLKAQITVTEAENKILSTKNQILRVINHALQFFGSVRGVTIEVSFDAFLRYEDKETISLIMEGIKKDLSDTLSIVESEGSLPYQYLITLNN